MTHHNSVWDSIAGKAFQRPESKLEFCDVTVAKKRTTMPPRKSAEPPSEDIRAIVTKRQPNKFSRKAGVVST
jgi:hypothetical protein